MVEKKHWELLRDTFVLHYRCFVFGLKVFFKTGNHGFYRIPRGGWGKMGIKQQISGIIVDQHGMADFSMASSPN
jgi:hypothetical protein